MLNGASRKPSSLDRPMTLFCLFLQIYKHVTIQRLHNNIVEIDDVGLSTLDLTEGGSKAVVEFTAASCAVLENEGKVRVGIKRYGKIDCACEVM